MYRGDDDPGQNVPDVCSRQVAEEICEHICDIEIDGVSIDNNTLEEEILNTLNNPTAITYLEARSGSIPETIKEVIINAVVDASCENKVWAYIKAQIGSDTLSSMFLELYSECYPSDLPADETNYL